MGIKWILACVAATPVLISAAEPVRLAPTSKWVLHYADDSCRLIRTFGDGKDKTVLVFESGAPDDTSMVAIGRPLRASHDGASVPTRLLPVQNDPFMGKPAKSARGGNPAVLWSHLPLVQIMDGREVIPAAARELMVEVKRGVRPPPIKPSARAAIKAERLAFASNATAIEMEPRRGHPVILETGSLGEPIRMFDQCGREQLRSWGIDPDLEDKIVRPVWAPAPHRWFGPSDYPADSIDRGEQSVVEYRLLVDASGKPTKCTSLSHVKAPAFQKVVCNTLMKRAHFEPAELADGTKVPSYYWSRVQWRIE